MAIYRTEVHERAVGPLRERSVPLPNYMKGWTSVLLYGRDSYFDNRLAAAVRIQRAAAEWHVRIRVSALHSADAYVDRNQAAEFGVARYFSAPQLLADLTQHAEHALSDRWRDQWTVRETFCSLTAERRYGAVRLPGAALDRLVADLWPLDRTVVVIGHDKS